MDFLLGVLGGMGPEAAVEFLRRLIRMTPAESDQEHLPTVLINDPRVPDRTAALTSGGPSPLPRLLRGALRLQELGCHLIVIPCNTAHAWLPELRREVKVPFLDIVEATVEEALEVSGARRAGLIATTGTLSAGLYQRALSARGVEVILPGPERQEEVMSIVFAVKKEGATDASRQRLKNIMEGLVARGAEVLIAGCTELPLVLPEAPPAPVADSLGAPARAVLRLAEEKGARKR